MGEEAAIAGEPQNLTMGNWASLGNSVLSPNDKSSSESYGCGDDAKTTVTDTAKPAQFNQSHPGLGLGLHDEELSMIKSFVFLDLESSALQSYDRPKITEVCLVAVHRSSIENASTLGGMTKPRVLDKLSLCVYPSKQIEPVASDITGLNNALLLENEKKAFNADVAESISAFLRRQSKPVCIVAHNGYNFDFKLLRTEFDYIGRSLPSDILCCDSLIAFKELEEEHHRCTQDSVSDIDVTHVSSNMPSNTNESSEKLSVEKSCVAPNIGSPYKKKKYSYALGKIYQRTFGKEPENVHDAESDVISLIQLVLNRGSTICTWMDTHATKWTDIQQYYVPSPKKMCTKQF
ncbi:three prime repair exonuclease 2-like [Anneissia japonica]|uniref:three prime repair exonuclease 2-like n=1 Tax=Anneissia japonica TaxID=1529436 RepID=UPI001425B68A|nr:three prime repair exonuclease 2-like [Anneissia japonica]